MTKIFGVGLAKTGTTSLCGALSELGYKTCHFPFSDSDYLSNDALADIPVADSFEKLDRRFPNSKFILTLRPMDGWLTSSEKHWRNKVESGAQKNIRTLEIMRRLYGRVPYDPERFREAYVRHEKRVTEYFKGREQDLLIFSIFDDKQPWETLCSFLGEEVPNTPFPHKNKADDKIVKPTTGPKGQIKKQLRNITYAILKHRYK